MNRLRVTAVAAVAAVILAAPSVAAAQRMCWRVPAIERNLSAYVRGIVAGGSAARQAGTFLLAAADTSVVVVTDTAQCRAVAVAHQRQEYADSLASPHPIVLIRSGEPASRSSLRYIVWDNFRLGEWLSVTVYDADLKRVGGWGW